MSKYVKFNWAGQKRYGEIYKDRGTILTVKLGNSAIFNIVPLNRTDDVEFISEEEYLIATILEL